MFSLTIFLLHKLMTGYSISDDNLKHVLYKTFRDRLEEVFDQAQHASSVPRSIAEGAAVGGGNRPIAQQPMDDKAADFVAGMDEWEKERECALL